MLKTNKYCPVRFDYLSPFFPFLLDGSSLYGVSLIFYIIGKHEVNHTRDKVPNLRSKIQCLETNHDPYAIIWFGISHHDFSYMLLLLC